MKPLSVNLFGCNIFPFLAHYANAPSISLYVSKFCSEICFPSKIHTGNLECSSCLAQTRLSFNIHYLRGITGSFKDLKNFLTHEVTAWISYLLKFGVWPFEDINLSKISLESLSFPGKKYKKQIINISAKKS